ncbi:hypothetical protein NK6_1078 [Bradyrhizobium diazoefficiens]|uniref:Uncharacterized protein n=1 Tax=Bradyrhizobium diazoefficiens TaxID=1355477 RepID=A0A0E4BL51_9BRAD|nr:hypothetical protein NK6_1078 [Bradyrhizobium diazoefficiens]
MNESERVQTYFHQFYAVPRERHDDFADQTNDVGIGATRHRTM